MNLDDARVLAELWMEHHGLKGWRFRFDDAVRRFGSCNYLRREITLSRVLTELNDEPKVENTILHEVAHALAGPGTHHGPRWKRVAASVGAAPRWCYGREVLVPQHRFVGTCPGCGEESHRDRRITCSCGRCSPKKYDARYRLEWKRA